MKMRMLVVVVVVLLAGGGTVMAEEPEVVASLSTQPRTDQSSSHSSRGTNTKASHKFAGRHDDPPHHSQDHHGQGREEKEDEHQAKCDEDDEECLKSSPLNSDDTCGIWLAPSTIPGSGMGMFAGRDFKTEESLGNTGDVVIPIVDMTLHQGVFDERRWSFLWDDYTWDSVFLHIDHEGINEVNVGSPGFGSAANCFLDLQNVEEWYPENHNILDRRYDPGAGGFSSYHNRLSTAKKEIQAGEELFVSYGDNWFLTREYMGPIPITGDLDRANELFQQYKGLKANHDIPDNILKDLWNDVVIQTNWTESRVLGSFNKANPDSEVDDLLYRFESLTQLRRSQASRNLTWIREHGVCCDNLQEGQSTMIQAGRGAFSTRFIPKGSVVAPLPMIHVPYDRRLNMYAFTKDAEGKTTLEQPKRMIGKQLLVNYCYGHEESTMLLCPYGMFVSLVNHNQSLANVRLQWADPAKSSLNASLLEQSVEYIDKQQKSAALAMDLVALRDIEEGEEVFLDYGDAWEEAWQSHLEAWQPHRYESPAAGQWNADRTSLLKTEFEQMTDPYPGTIELRCNKAFRENRRDDWQPLLDEGSTEALERFGREEGIGLRSCELLRRRVDKDNNNRVLYTALLNRLKDEEGGEKVGDENMEIMEDVPREAFQFVDRPYKSDMFLPDAFRHAIMIPDDIFPDAWKNLQRDDDVGGYSTEQETEEEE